jgi:hypothetical protein
MGTGVMGMTGPVALEFKRFRREAAAVYRPYRQGLG